MAAALHVLQLALLGSAPSPHRLGGPRAMAAARARARSLVTCSSAGGMGGPTPPGAVRYRALVAYDGACFAGFQLQPGGVDTVQARLEAAFATRFRVPVRVIAASRTDAGVHARGQVVHFDAPQLDEPAARTQWSANAMLPPSVRVRELELAPVSADGTRRWHAMACALGKHYAYRWHVGDVPDPLERHARAHSRPPRSKAGAPFDLRAVERAAQHFVGEHDFSSFVNVGEPRGAAAADAARSPVRVVHGVGVEDEGRGRVRLDFFIQSALYKQVRNMAGTLAAVGWGELGPDDIPRLLARRDRSGLPPPAPAHGLTLERVWCTDEPCAGPWDGETARWGRAGEADG